jgi:hypothetical protein
MDTTKTSEDFNLHRRATERGGVGYDKNRRDFSKRIWRQASPKWDFDDATFDRSSAAFDNPDHVAIVIHGYRWRLDLADGERKYDDLEKKLAQGPSSQYARSPWKATPTARPIPTPQPIAANSPGDMSTGSSSAASATICCKRLRKPSPKRPSPPIKHNRPAPSPPPRSANAILAATGNGWERRRSIDSKREAGPAP